MKDPALAQIPSVWEFLQRAIVKNPLGLACLALDFFSAIRVAVLSFPEFNLIIPRSLPRAPLAAVQIGDFIAVTLLR